MLAWHFTIKGFLRDGSPLPPTGEWLEHKGEIKLCIEGFHASVELIDALGYAPGLQLHLVELGGRIIRGKDKAVAEKRRILRSWDVDPRLLLQLAIEAACIAASYTNYDTRKLKEAKEEITYSENLSNAKKLILDSLVSPKESFECTAITSIRSAYDVADYISEGILDVACNSAKRSINYTLEAVLIRTRIQFNCFVAELKEAEVRRKLEDRAKELFTSAV
jgi:hypothetical protein